MIYIEFKAPQDNSGNPRRVCVIFTSTGKIADILDEGYIGIQVVKQWNKTNLNIMFAGSFEITVKEYNNLIKKSESKDYD